MILYYILFLYGLTTIMVKSLIFKSLREILKKHITFLGKMINCMLCMSFWIGFASSIIFYGKFTELFLSDITYINYMMFAVFSSGVVWLIYMLQLFLTNNNEEYKKL